MALPRLPLFVLSQFLSVTKISPDTSQSKSAQQQPCGVRFRGGEKRAGLYQALSPWSSQHLRAGWGGCGGAMRREIPGGASRWEEVEARVASWKLLFLGEVQSYFLISAIHLWCGVRKPKA